MMPTVCWTVYIFNSENLSLLCNWMQYYMILMSNADPIKLGFTYKNVKEKERGGGGKANKDRFYTTIGKKKQL